MKKNKIVRFATLLLMAAMLFTLCACGLSRIGKKIESIPTVQQSVDKTPEPVDAAPAEEDKSADYEAALGMMVDGKYESAAAAFDRLGDYKDSAARAEQAREKMQETRYQAAVALMEEGKVREAFAAFSTMPGYKDADERAAQLKELVAMQDELAGTKESDIITFGTYEQDNKQDTPAEPIQWIVIGKEYESLTLLSLYMIDVGPYDEERADVTWEDSALRRWLNDEFIVKAFSDDERDLLLLTTVPPHDNPKHPYDYQDNPIMPGNQTNDRVWILSEEEAKALPASILKADSTRYAKSGGTSTTGSTYYTVTDPNGNAENPKTIYVDYSVDWWLRTPGDLQRKAMYMSDAGKLMYEGYYVDFAQFGIRPVIRISIA